jgi:hypothetical protein
MKTLAIILLFSLSVQAQDSLECAKKIQRIEKTLKLTSAVALGIGTFYFAREKNLPKSIPIIAASAIGIGIIIELSPKKKPRRKSRIRH